MCQAHKNDHLPAFLPHRLCRTLSPYSFWDAIQNAEQGPKRSLLAYSSPMGPEPQPEERLSKLHEPKTKSDSLKIFPGVRALPF